MVWGSNTGPVLQNEIETALGMIANVPVVTKVGAGNILSDGALGQAAYSAGILFETTGDVRALDLAMKFADNILALRNDAVTGAVLWTGRRELVWPTTTVYPYAGSENGDILGHMVNAAVYVLKTPCLWAMVPPPYSSSSPTVFDQTDSYLTRALAFVDAADDTIDTYFLPWWFSSQNLMIQPNDQRYLLANDVGNLPGAPMACETLQRLVLLDVYTDERISFEGNRRILLLSGFFRLVAAHETTPAFDASRVAKYDAIILANINDFLGGLKSTFASTGQSTYLWYYRKTNTNVEEVMGVHGYYDVIGLWEARQRYGSSVVSDSVPDFVFQNSNFTEDCLYLNVWRSGKVNSKKLLPILFWIHGGAFSNGAASEGLYIPYGKAQQGRVQTKPDPMTFELTDIIEYAEELGEPIIYVSINYRLNGFGFLAHADLPEEDNSAGLLDRQCNTLENNFFNPVQIPKLASVAGGSLPPLFASTNCTDLECLRRAPADDLFTGISTYLNNISAIGTRIGFPPVLGGYISELPSPRFASTDRVGSLPTLMTSVMDEGTIFTTGLLGTTPGLYEGDLFITDEPSLSNYNNYSVKNSTFTGLDTLYTINSPSLLVPFEANGNVNITPGVPLTPYIMRATALVTDQMVVSPRRVWLDAAISRGKA
ncbi:hypothetical protein P7C70_g4964, partial [Phenoliferia sp. Uapishka_3]